MTAARWKGFFKLRKEKNTMKSSQKINSEFKARSRALAVHFWPEADIRKVEHTDRADDRQRLRYRAWRLRWTGHVKSTVKQLEATEVRQRTQA